MKGIGRCPTKDARLHILDKDCMGSRKEGCVKGCISPCIMTARTRHFVTASDGFTLHPHFEADKADQRKRETYTERERMYVCVCVDEKRPLT